ncbi:hypothetical protein WA577_006932, partial [Blastocystis sp. JDR]
MKLLEDFRAFSQAYLHEDYCLVAALVFSICIILFILRFIKFIAYYALPGKNLKRAFGEWALVTGATDGIGLGYAKRLAARGVNVILVSRSQERLDAAAEEIRERYHVETRTVAFDMNGSLEELKAVLLPVIEKYPIGILVNNVGISYEYAMYLEELPEDRLQTIIHLNCEVTAMVTKLCVPGMVERKRGAVVSISSAAGIMACGDPLYDLYSASKGFVDLFSRSLATELKEKGIVVECHVPYFVPTKLSKIRRSSLFCPRPEVFAESSLRKIGRGPITVVPYFWHEVQHIAFHLLPFWLLQKCILIHHKDIRRRALKKREK